MDTRPRPRAIDRRLGPAPNRYLVVPEQFGSVADAEFCVPEGGAEHIQRLALSLHRLCCTFRAVTSRGAQAELARTYRVSTSTVSDALAGKCWPSATVLLAIRSGVADAAAPSPVGRAEPRRRSRSGFPIVDQRHRR